jgi:hypothetical protein
MRRPETPAMMEKKTKQQPGPHAATDMLAMTTVAM